MANLRRNPAMNQQQITTKVAEILAHGSVGIVFIKTNLVDVRKIGNFIERSRALRAGYAAARVPLEAYIAGHPEGSIINLLEGSSQLIVKGTEQFFRDILTRSDELNIESLIPNKATAVALA